jgi:hypothetical protein
MVLPAVHCVRDRRFEKPSTVAYGPAMAPILEVRQTTAEPSHVPSGAALLAIELSEIARGIRGLDVLRRSVDRAPPA